MRRLTLALLPVIGAACPAAPMMKSALPWAPSLSSLEGWEPVHHRMEGQWSVSGGRIYQDSQDQGGLTEDCWTALLGAQAFGDMTLSAVIQPLGEGPGDSVGVVFAWRDEANHWRLRLDSGWDSPGASRAVLEHVASGERHEIAQRPIDPLADFAEIAVVIRGETLQAFLDERALFWDIALEGGATGRAGLLATGAGKASYRGAGAEAARPVHPRITMGPWMSNITPESVTLSWVFDRPMRAQVWLGPEASEYAPLDLPELRGEARDHWEVTIPGLVPGQRWLGRILYGAAAIDGTPGWDVAGNFSFRTAPADAAASFRLGVWGDNRSDPAAHRLVAEALAAEAPDLAINVGDVVTNGLNPHEWREEYFEPAASLLASVPTLIAIGNHERDADLFYDLFPHPGRRNWFALTYGSMRLVVLDSNQPLRPGSPQRDWLLEEIESPSFNAATWRIAAFHHPPFSQGWDSPGYDGEPRIRRHLWPVLRDARFHLLLLGHTHDYERGELDGVTMVITGGGGSPLDHFEQRIPFMTVFDASYQFCTVDVSPTSLDFAAKTPSGRIIDRFTLEP